MSVKRYWSYAGGDSSMQETETGNYVKYEDYASIERKNIDMAVQLANAESKCRDLAADNAGLKATCDDRRTFIMNGVQLGYIKVPTVESDPALETIRVAVSPQEPTPATDAFLAEVRAQGVEMLLDSLPPHYTARAGIEKFAAQLRKGAAI